MLKKEMVEMIVTNGWATEAELKGLKKDELIGVIESAKRKSYPINPLDDPEIQKMDVSDEALLKPIEETAEQKLAKMNPGFINVTVKKEEETMKENNNNVTINNEAQKDVALIPTDGMSIMNFEAYAKILAEHGMMIASMPVTKQETIVPVGDLDITSDKMVVAEEKKEEKMDNKEYNKQLCIGAVVYAWIQKSGAKNKHPLFFTATRKGDFCGNKISSRKYVFAATCEAVEAVFSYKKLGTERYQQVRDWLVEAGYCHLYNGVDIHMTTDEWNKCVQLTQLIFTKAKEHNYKTVMEYINSRKR